MSIVTSALAVEPSGWAADNADVPKKSPTEVVVQDEQEEDSAETVRRGIAAIQKLLSVRRDRRVSQTTLAKKVGVSRPQISHLQEGTRKQPRAGLLIRIAEALDVSLDWAIGRDVHADAHRNGSLDADDPPALRAAFEQQPSRWPPAVLAAARRSGLSIDQGGWVRFLDRMLVAYDEARTEASASSERSTDSSDQNEEPVQFDVTDVSESGSSRTAKSRDSATKALKRGRGAQSSGGNTNDDRRREPAGKRIARSGSSRPPR